MEEQKYTDIVKALNITDKDVEILARNITPYVDKKEYFDMVDDDYDNGRTVKVSVTEYKNSVMMEYFIELLFGHNLEGWVEYGNVRKNAIELYNATFNTSKKVVNKLNGVETEEPLLQPKEEPKIIIPE